MFSERRVSIKGNLVWRLPQGNQQSTGLASVRAKHVANTSTCSLKHRQTASSLKSTPRKWVETTNDINFRTTEIEDLKAATDCVVASFFFPCTYVLRCFLDQRCFLDALGPMRKFDQTQRAWTLSANKNTCLTRTWDRDPPSSPTL